MVIFMFGIVLTLVLFIAMGFVRGEGMSWRVNKKQLLALVGVLVIVFSCYVSIPAGHTGVVTTFGSVENYTLEAGMHFKLPWQEVIKMDNRVQKSTQDMSCFSSDIQEVSMTYTVNYQISKQDDLKDYLYDAEKLRTLSGRAYHKKKNLVNKFKKMYEGRWEYRSLTGEDAEEIRAFLEHWYATAKSEEEGLDKEKDGIWEVLRYPVAPGIRMGSIFVDGKMEAFTMGNYNELEEMAFICVEKANSQIPGLYQTINQQFIVQEFPDSRVVNREDDVGLEGLRKAKLSYNPIGYAEKYTVIQSLY